MTAFLVTSIVLVDYSVHYFYNGSELETETIKEMHQVQWECIDFAF